LCSSTSSRQRAPSQGLRKLSTDTKLALLSSTPSAQSAAHYTEAAEDEVKLLRAIRDTNAEAKGRERVVLLMDDFKHYGPHGAHICMVMEVLGNNLLHLIKAHNYRGISLILVRRILRQVRTSNSHFARCASACHTRMQHGCLQTHLCALLSR